MNEINTHKRQGKFFLIFSLGALTALSPFSIDMYLPAFPVIAQDLKTTVPNVSLSLSSYFVGLASGQLFYGPLLDRFGRKKPLYVGLIIYILASIACILANTTDALIISRFIQAIGGCAAGVTSMSMVRDLFSTKESAKVFSLLILVLGASPLVAPTIGGYVSEAYGWHSLFIILALIGVSLLLTAIFYLRETHQPDKSTSLEPIKIAKQYINILKVPQFYCYVLTSAVCFSGLFVYITGSPMLFMEFFKVEPTVYGWIFGINAAGFITVSQLNVLLLKKYDNVTLLRTGLILQSFVALVMLIGTYYNWLGLEGTVVCLFMILGCLGIINPNASSLALAPFAKIAGSASALLGFMQMSVGAIASMITGLVGKVSPYPVVVALCISSTLALTILFLGRKNIKREVRAKGQSLESFH